MSCSVVQASLVPRCLVPALCFHISLTGLAACSITFNYPPCQRTDSGCLLALVITGFRGQVIRSWLHCHSVRLLRPQGAYGMKEFAHLQSVICYQAQIYQSSLEQIYLNLLQCNVMCSQFFSFTLYSRHHAETVRIMCLCSELITQPVLLAHYITYCMGPLLLPMFVNSEILWLK